MRKLQNKIQLITYPDSLGNNLSDLKDILDEHFRDSIGGVHILPFYPSSADRGFAPLTHLEVDSKFGNWQDIKRLSRDYDFVCDLIVNHISSESKYFQDYLKNGESSPYRDYFITAEKFARRIKRRYHPNDSVAHVAFDFLGDDVRRFVERYPVRLLESVTSRVRALDIFFHKHGVNRFVIKKIYRPRPTSPFIQFNFEDGAKRRIWCTFSNHQIDLDITNPDVLKLLDGYIANLSKQGVKMVRLDAAGYACKKRGTSNFLIPDTFKFITWLAKTAHAHGVSVLPEVHFHYIAQIKLSQTEGVDYVYDFGLPMLVLHALFDARNHNLLRWLRIRPQKAITTLDTHDGLPVPDIEGFLTKEEIDKVKIFVHINGGNDLMRASGGNADNLDLYQLNITYYSALGENDDAYIAARAIQFFVPGIPQVYYVGMLAGRNDVERLERTNIGRDINRHAYTREEISQEMKRPVVKRLHRLMRFRNTYPAFNGKFEVVEGEEHLVILQWRKGEAFCEAKVDLRKYKTRLRYFDLESQKIITKII